MKKILASIARSKAVLKMEDLFTMWDYLPVGTAKSVFFPQNCNVLRGNE
jgi:hypothetical protein